MSIHVVENLNAPIYRFTDPDCFLSCDNPACSSAWVTSTGLMVWAIEGYTPSGSHFSDKLIAACSPDCLRSALHARGRGFRWSEPMPVADWLKAMHASIELDPVSTPIGEFASTT